nr:hypothetical protein [uncultured bacterium]
MFAKATSRIYAAIPNVKPFSVNRHLVKTIKKANSSFIPIKYPEVFNINLERNARIPREG